MQVFVSWSGERSRLIAEAIRNWLPMVLQSVKPWMSDQDIAAGARWLTEVSTTLSGTKVGLICITPENQHNPWLLFEAGALSKTLEQTCVCPLVFETTPGQLTGPLTQFQANSLDRDGIGKVLTTINKALGDRRVETQQMEEILDVWWPKLQERLNGIPATPAPAAVRSTSDQLEELLTLVREQLRRENIRLDASKERDEKIDSLLGFMDEIGAKMGTVQGQAQRAMAKAFDAALTNQRSMQASDTSNVIEMADAFKEAASLIGPGSIDLATMRQYTGLLRELRERDKERTKSMLTPPPEGESSE